LKQDRNIALEIFESKISIHLIFIFFFLGFFCSPAIFSTIPLKNTVLAGLFFLLCIYTGRWICGRWLMNTELIQFLVYSGIAVLSFSLSGMLVLRHFFKTHSAGIIITIFCIVTLFIFLGSFLSITRSSIIRQIRESDIARHQRESELKLLRSQLSPHFLFNILNNLYGLSARQDKRVPGLILRLSDLLRHSLYDTYREFIPLTSEVAYIENYIELERIRIGEKLILESDIQKAGIDGIRIAPMLLIVFVENAFKHSKDTVHPEIFINIDLHLSDGKLIFTVRNSCQDKPEEKKTDESGIGLAVTEKRLELLYHGKYTLHKKQENGFYEVTLQLNPEYDEQI
jgi:sensor histidine kinase YesM